MQIRACHILTIRAKVSMPYKTTSIKLRVSQISPKFDRNLSQFPLQFPTYN